jgi:hypothetical protein
VMELVESLDTEASTAGPLMDGREGRAPDPMRRARETHSTWVLADSGLTVTPADRASHTVGPCGHLLQPSCRPGPARLQSTGPHPASSHLESNSSLTESTCKRADKKTCVTAFIFSFKL